MGNATISGIQGEGVDLFRRQFDRQGKNRSISFCIFELRFQFSFRRDGGLRLSGWALGRMALGRMALGRMALGRMALGRMARRCIGALTRGANRRGDSYPHAKGAKGAMVAMVASWID